MDGETYLSKYVYYETRINCSTYRFDLAKINLLDIKNLNNYLYKLEEEGEVFQEFSESGNGSCGKKLCKWQMEVRKNTCDVATQTTIFGDEVVDMYYKVCDTNNENCKRVPVEEFGYYGVDTGYLFDLNICTGNEKTGEACRLLVDGNWDVIIN